MEGLLRTEVRPLPLPLGLPLQPSLARDLLLLPRPRPLVVEFGEVQSSPLENLRMVSAMILLLSVLHQERKLRKRGRQTGPLVPPLPA